MAGNSIHDLLHARSSAVRGMVNARSSDTTDGTTSEATFGKLLFQAVGDNTETLVDAWYSPKSSATKLVEPQTIARQEQQTRSLYVTSNSEFVIARITLRARFKIEDYWYPVSEIISISQTEVKVVVTIAERSEQGTRRL